jgi:hypothetical protein
MEAPIREKRRHTTPGEATDRFDGSEPALVRFFRNGEASAQGKAGKTSANNFFTSSGDRNSTVPRQCPGAL